MNTHKTQMQLLALLTATMLAQTAPAQPDQGQAPTQTARGAGRLVAISRTGSLLTSANGQTWSEVKLPFRTFLRGLTFGCGQFIAVGGSYVDMPGVILTSGDGVRWQVRRAGGRENLYAVACADSLFVGVGDKGCIWTSADGAKWERRRSSSAALLCSVAAHKGVIVVGGESGNILTSTNGRDWITRQAATLSYLNKITVEDAGFVLCGTPEISLCSSDGIINTANR